MSKRAQTTTKQKFKTSSPEPRTLKGTGLTTDELAIKDKLISGGQFDALGEKFSRNRKYSV